MGGGGGGGVRKRSEGLRLREGDWREDSPQPEGSFHISSSFFFYCSDTRAGCFNESQNIPDCVHIKGLGYMFMEVVLYAICIINRVAFEKQNVSTNNLGHQTTSGHFFQPCNWLLMQRS